MAFVSCSPSGESNDANRNEARRMMGPQMISQMIGQAITSCWMILPDDKKTADNLETEIRRIVDRTLANFRDDMRSFGIEPPSK